MPKLPSKLHGRIDVSRRHSVGGGCPADTKHLTVISFRIRRFAVSDKTLFAFTSNFNFSWATKPLWGVVTHPHSFSFMNNNFVGHYQNHFKCLFLPLVPFLQCLGTLLKVAKVKPYQTEELTRVITWTTATIISWFGPNLSPLLTVSPNSSRLANETRTRHFDPSLYLIYILISD